MTEGEESKKETLKSNETDKSTDIRVSTESKVNTVIEETKISEESSKDVEEQTKIRVISVSDKTTMVNPQTDSSHSASNQAEINQVEINQPERIEFNVGSYDYYELYGHSGYQMELEDKDLSGTVYTDSEIVSMRYKIENVKRKLLKEDTITPEKQWVIKDIPLYLGGCYITVYATLSNGHELTNEVWIFNDHEERMQGLNADMSDKDGDGLEADIEEIYGTDPNNADTDGDGLNDYIELVEIGTDPLKVDSDGDGRPDGDDDADEDGLTNIEEARLGTYTWGSYTDEDLLSDYEEVKIYGTDPLNRDTDGDGKDDDWEVENGYNPLVADIFFTQNVIEAADATTMVLTVKATGDNLATLTAVAASEDMFINDTIPGFIDAGYDFHIDGVFVEANLMCYFDPSLMETEGFNPMVYYYDEDNHTLKEVQTTWNGSDNYVTARLEHFSRYMLIDKSKYYRNKFDLSESETIAMYEELSAYDAAKLQYCMNTFLFLSDENSDDFYRASCLMFCRAYHTDRVYSYNVMVTPSKLKVATSNNWLLNGWQNYTYNYIGFTSYLLFDSEINDPTPEDYKEKNLCGTFTPYYEGVPPKIYNENNSWEAFTAFYKNAQSDLGKGYQVVVIDEVGANMILSNPEEYNLYRRYGKVYYIGNVDERIYDYFPESRYVIVKCDTPQDYFNTIMLEEDFACDLDYEYWADFWARGRKQEIRLFWEQRYGIVVPPFIEENIGIWKKDHYGNDNYYYLLGLKRKYYSNLIEKGIIKLSTGANIPDYIVDLIKVKPEILDDFTYNYKDFVTVNIPGRYLLQSPTPEATEFFAETIKEYPDIFGKPNSIYDMANPIYNHAKYTQNIPSRTHLVCKTDMNWLFNDEMYLGSDFANRYLNDGWLKTQLFVGNALLNHKIDEKKMYKKAILEMLSVLNQAMLDDYSDKVFEETYIESFYDMFSVVQNYVSLINEIPDDMVKSTLMHELDIDYFLKISDCFESRDFFVNEEGITIVDAYFTKLASVLDDLPKKYPTIMKKYDNHNLTGKLATKLKTSALKIPKNMREKYARFGKKLQYAGYVCIAGDTISEAYDDLKVLSVLDAQDTLCDDYENLLLIMSVNSRNKYNSEALRDIRKAMKDEKANRNEKALMVVEDLLEGGFEAAKVFAIENAGKVLSSTIASYLWAADFGLSIGDAVFKVGDTDEKAMYTISIGDSANALCVKVKEDLLKQDYDMKNYKVDDKTYMYLSTLCQLRIISENLFYDMSDSAVIKVNKGKIKSDIKSNIRIVIGIIKDNDFSAIANYNGAKVHVN